MTLLCELVRRSFLRMTTRSWACLPQSKSGDDDAGGKMQMGRQRFLFVFLLYHIFCVSLVTVALCNDWATTSGGGSFSWELWAIWQHVCLWMLFLQNLLRCLREGEGALHRSTICKVLQYTAPLASELADTLKDWIVTGICLLADPTLLGVVCGGVIVAADVLARLTWEPPDRFPFRIMNNVRIFPPLTVLPLGFMFAYCFGAVSFLMIPSQWIESVARVPLFYTLCFGLLLLIVEIHPVLMVSALWSQVLLIICLKQGDSFGFGSLFAAMFNIISDGGCLCVLSIYMILLSHILVVSNPDTFLEIRKTYRGILSLPKAAPLTLSGLSLYDRASDMASALATDFCSTARLMIAWAEDLPQGFIGLLLVLSQTQENGRVGLAGLSALISFVKGIGIPIGQGMLLASKERKVEEGLKQMDLFQFVDKNFDGQELLSTVSIEKELHSVMQSLEERVAVLQEALNNADREIEVAHGDAKQRLRLRDERSTTQELLQGVQSHLHSERDKHVTTLAQFRERFRADFKGAIEARNEAMCQRFSINKEVRLYDSILTRMEAWPSNSDVTHGFVMDIEELLRQPGVSQRP